MPGCQADSILDIKPECCTDCRGEGGPGPEQLMGQQHRRHAGLSTGRRSESTGRDLPMRRLDHLTIRFVRTAKEPARFELKYHRMLECSACMDSSASVHTRVDGGCMLHALPAVSGLVRMGRKRLQDWSVPNAAEQLACGRLASLHGQCFQQVQTGTVLRHTMIFRSTARELAKCMFKYIESQSAAGSTPLAFLAGVCIEFCW